METHGVGMDKLAIGIASYGEQPADWWEHLAWELGTLHKYNIDLIGIYTARSMATDSNRNRITSSLLKSKADWFYWIDTDNNTPMGGIRRLLDTKKELVSGLYFQKNEKRLPVAYLQIGTNRYRPIKDWNRGELLPIDAAGMGACLVHRSVFETIEKNFTVLARWNGGITVVHNSDIRGEIGKEIGSPPKLVDGVWQETFHLPEFEVEYFPHFILQYGRTEDMVFYENARRCGFQPFVDTSVEVEHLMWRRITGADYREALHRETSSIPRLTEYVDVELLEASKDAIPIQETAHLDADQQAGTVQEMEEGTRSQDRSEKEEVDDGREKEMDQGRNQEAGSPARADGRKGRKKHSGGKTKGGRQKRR